MLAGTPCCSCQRSKPASALALRLLNDHGVYVHPGHFYEFPGQRSIVVSLITPPNDFSSGLQDLLAAIR